jgi:hypothetical protein
VWYFNALIIIDRYFGCQQIFSNTYPDTIALSMAILDGKPFDDRESKAIDRTRQHSLRGCLKSHRFGSLAIKTILTDTLREYCYIYKTLVCEGRLCSDSGGFNR